jgi:4-carboxymuconolactone decarboxylase
MTPRIGPLPREEWDDDVETALRAGVPANVGDQFMSTGPDNQRVPNAIATMMHLPVLTGRFLAFNATILREGVLPARLREIMVLRVAWRTRSEYEWVQHARLAHRYAITREEIDAIPDGPGGGSWTPIERDLLSATDQLLDDTRIDDETWARLAAEFSPKELTEIVFTIGTYTCLAMVFNGLGVELDPELDPSVAPLLPE